MSKYYVGVDIGGTFTDVFVSDGDHYWEGKASTTPGRLHEGLLDAIEVAAQEMGITAESPITNPMGLPRTAAISYAA